MLSTMLASSGEEGAIVGAIAVGGSFVVAIFWIVAETIQKTVISKHREESRREIAAYVAEGTITPDDAAKILAAGRSIKDKLKEKLGA